ncbi:MAG: hemolysin family protein [Caldilineaceae bacterium]|nr:HlyC/CorC family transporter [Caldilineaceae bacterium]
MTWLVILATIVILIGINALYVAAEFATISARRSRIAQMAEEEDNRAARALLPLMEDVHRLDTYVAACQIGITISSLVLGFYGQATLSGYLSPLLVRLGGLAEVTAQSISATVVLLLLTMLQVVLGELVPKNIGVQYPEQLALVTVYPMRWSLTVLRPLIWFFNGSGRLILRLLGIQESSEHAHIHAPEEILMLVEESGAGGLLEKEERRLLENTLRLRALTTRQVMIPRTRMFAASADLPVSELLELLAESPHSRLPLYEESVDNIVGLVHLKDLLCLHQLEDNGAARDVMRDIRFVFESTPADEVFVTLQKQQYNMAIVLDEYGGTAGMVTLEDLVEEIFGELQDEFDIELPVLQIQSDNRVVLRGDALITDLNDWLDLTLDSEEVDTIGGLILSEAGDVPAEKDEFEIADLHWRIEKMDGKAIQSVSMIVSPDKARQLREERL